MKQSDSPNIFEYSNFRSYLRDCYLHRKSLDPHYSYRRFSDAAELGSPNYLKLVIDGNRSMTVSNIHRFAKALHLEFNEVRYFEVLVHLGQAGDTDERAYYKTTLNELNRSRKTAIVRKSSSTALLNEPATTAVVVCVNDVPVERAATLISKKAGVSSDKVARIIETLIAEELVEIRDGRYWLSDSYIQFHDRKSKSSTQKQFVRSQIQNSMRALETRYSRDAKFYCNTFTIAEGSLELLQSKVASWLDELMSQTNQDSPDRVIQLNMQLFPFSI